MKKSKGIKLLIFYQREDFNIVEEYLLLDFILGQIMGLSAESILSQPHHRKILELQWTDWMNEYTSIKTHAEGYNELMNGTHGHAL